MQRQPRRQIYATFKPICFIRLLYAGFATTWDCTTLKHCDIRQYTNQLFYYHLGLHYSQTQDLTEMRIMLFYYHLGLHYSQTTSVCLFNAAGFYYHLGLHYSQTKLMVKECHFWFYYHLGLHYSQTCVFLVLPIF